MEKTNLEWFEWAKEQGYEWADAAIRYSNCNTLAPIFYPLGDASSSLKEALFWAFEWEDTKEGEQYWSNIFRELKDKGL